MDDFDNDQHEIEAGERWLATFDTPGPSLDASAGVKRAIRKQISRPPLRRADRWPAWAGAVAAAGQDAKPHGSSPLRIVFECTQLCVLLRASCQEL